MNDIDSSSNNTRPRIGSIVKHKKCGSVQIFGFDEDDDSKVTVRQGRGLTSTFFDVGLADLE